MHKRKKLSLAACGGIGVLTAAALTPALLVPAAILIHRQVLPMDSGRLLSAVAAGLSAALSTWLAARLRGRQILLTAGLTAAGILLSAVIAGLLAGTGESMGAWLPRLLCAVLTGCCAGTVMSLRQNPQKKRRHRVR